MQKGLLVKHSKRASLLLSFLVFVFLGNAATYYSNSADPSLVTNWWTSTNGTGTHPANFTTSGDIFILQFGQTCTTSQDWTIGAPVTLQIDGSLSVSSKKSVTITGTIVFTNTNATQVTLNSNGANGSSIVIDGTLKTKNINGLSGPGCSLPAATSLQVVTLSQ